MPLSEQIPLLGAREHRIGAAVVGAVEPAHGRVRQDDTPLVVSDGAQDRVELRLALGATARRASHPVLRAAVGAGLTPVINGMMIAGIVAIPGLTTGQILAGADVGVTLRYQVLIYFGIAGTVGLSTLMLLAIRLRRYFTPHDQLRRDRLGERVG